MWLLFYHCFFCAASVSHAINWDKAIERIGFYAESFWYGIVSGAPTLKGTTSISLMFTNTATLLHEVRCVALLAGHKLARG